MEKEYIEVLSVDSTRFAHPSMAAKGWKAIAKVNVRYHSMGIYCNLIRGLDKKTQKPFYFLELPCFRYLDNRTKKWKKINHFNFQSKLDSDQFQNEAFGQVFHLKPDLFEEDLKAHREKDLYEGKEPKKDGQNG